MSLCLFTANRTGELLLEELSDRNFFPPVVTYTRGFQRTSLAKDLGTFKRDFDITFIAANSYLTCENLPDLSDSTVVCIDWTKDFFKDAEMVGLNIIYAHPSRLPLYRGYSAVTEQFIRGVVKSGASFYMQSAHVDAGDVIYSSDIEIDFQDYPEDFLRKYASACADFIVELNKKGINAFPPIKQDDNEAFYLQRKRGKDALIDFNRDAFSIYNHIRGYSRPFFGAHYYNDKGKIIIWKASTEVWQGDYGTAGKVINITDNGAEVACGSGSITIHEAELDGKIYTGSKLSEIL